MRHKGVVLARNGSKYGCGSQELRVLYCGDTHNSLPTLVTIRRDMNTQETPDSSEGGHIHRPAVRLPPIWPVMPSLWFAQAEAQFALACITSERTKFNYVISQLEFKHAAEVKDIITSPPTDGHYTTLKTELVRRLSSSRDQRVRQLLMHEEMGDRKPSQFLRHLKSLAPDVPDDFLRSIWSSRLPRHIETILAGQAEGNLEAASQLADRIAEVALLPTTAAIAQAPDTISLLQKIEDLSRQVAALSSGHARHHSRSRDNRTTKDVPSPAYGTTDRGCCRYYRQFGDKA